jgi:hypothetical protein
MIDQPLQAAGHWNKQEQGGQVIPVFKDQSSPMMLIQ